MSHNASRRGAADMGTILMIAAFAVIGFFMFWLNGQAADERAAREVIEETPEETIDPTIPEVRLGDIENGFNADDFVGQTVTTPTMDVASLLGTQGFWVNTPSGPFLVTWSPELMAEGATVNQGDRVVVVGEMRAMDMSAIDAWATQGTITENDRIVAEFATHLVRAETVQVEDGGADDTMEGNGN